MYRNFVLSVADAERVCVLVVMEGRSSSGSFVGHWWFSFIYLFLKVLFKFLKFSNLL